MTQRQLDTVTIRPPLKAELQAVRQLRFNVLDADKGITLQLSSQVDDDPRVIHMAAFQGDEIICTVRLHPVADNPQIYVVRRLATRPDCRRQGIGQAVLQAAEAQALHRGAAMFRLDSRMSAYDFYQNRGYRDTGERILHGDEETAVMIKEARS